MSEMPQADPQSPATAPEPSPEVAGKKGFFPSARVRALSRVALTLGLCAFFLILGFVSIRYSRDQARQTVHPMDVPVQGQVLTPEELERIAQRTRRLVELKNQLESLQEVAPPPPPTTPPPVAPPRRATGGRNSVFSVPMTPRGGRSAGGSLLDSPRALLEEGRHLVDSLRSGTPGDTRGSLLEEGGSVVAGTTRNTLVLQPQPPHPFRLRQGSFLPVVLDHPINTDVPGLIRGHLARDVRDSTGEHLLLPQGTVLVGRQASSLSTGDARLLIDWHQLQLPDGHTLDLPQPQGTAATDGSLGATGDIDRHFGSRFGTALLLGALGATVQLSQPQQSATFGQGASERQIAAGEVGARLNDLAERTLEERFNRPPTIRIPAGARLQLLLLQDLVFPSPQISSRRIGREGRDEAAGNPPPTPPLRKEGRPHPSPSVLHPSGWHSVAPGVNPGEAVGRAATGGRPYTSHAPTGTGGASPLQSPSVLHPSGWHSVAPGVNPGKR